MQTSKKNADHLNVSVGRIGHHFISSIVERACQFLGLSINALKREWEPKQSSHIQAGRAKAKKRTAKSTLLHGLDTSSNSHLSQEELDKKAREALKDLFPKIPDRDLNMVIARAFDKVIPAHHLHQVCGRAN